MFEIKLPDRFTHVKQIGLRKEYCLGFEYFIEILSIVRGLDGALFVRQYTNQCYSGANGRPCTMIRDVCCTIRQNVSISGINENNWGEYIVPEEKYDPAVVIENTNGTYVDQEALAYAKEGCR